MEAKIINEKESPLLSRKEVSIEFDFPNQKTPSKEEVLKKAVELLKTDANLIFLKKLYQHFGIGKAKVVFHVYHKVEDLNRIEKIAKKPKKAKAAAPAPQKK